MTIKSRPNDLSESYRQGQGDLLVNVVVTKANKLINRKSTGLWLANALKDLEIRENILKIT